MDLDNKKPRKQTAQQKLNNFLRSDEAKTYPLDGYTRAVLHALASYFYYSLECYPSIPSIINYCQFERRTVERSLCTLDALGLIRIVKRRGAKNRYLWGIPDVKDAQIYERKTVDNSIVE